MSSVLVITKAMHVYCANPTCRIGHINFYIDNNIIYNVVLLWSHLSALRDMLKDFERVCNCQRFQNFTEHTYYDLDSQITQHKQNSN